ncbi:MAG TPA: hypothetical protein VMZ53_30065 [Kofleriaceae bacterium]|nr:hypothetical protein [Kofleriaceae bacterium]
MRGRLWVVGLLLLVTRLAHADGQGDEYAAQVKLMFRIAACGNTTDAVPERLSEHSITGHCQRMNRIYAGYKKAWVDKAKPFIAKLRPTDVPATVVYPFGGGDLSSALTVYPDATEITTISLEAAGDVRAVDSIDQKRLDADLDAISKDINRLYKAAHSTTQSLQQASHSILPGTIMFALAGLAVHDMEPVQLRYFDLEKDGTLHYLTAKEMDDRAEKIGRPYRTKKKWVEHFWYEQHSAFGNVEIQFRPRGDTKAAVRTYRHILANLDDKHMKDDDRVLKHLASKGKVAVMTKAASFLLWWDDFSQIRDYLLANTQWMISDASGIPLRYAEKAGYELVTYGDFAGPYFTQDPIGARKEFIKLWAEEPHRDLPFRFGYPDKDKKNHLMVMQPKARAKS